MTQSYCGQCGQAALADELFCVGCGQRLRRPGPSAPAAESDNAASLAEDEIAMRHAVELIARGEPKVAITVLERLVQERPAWAIARAYLGLAYLRITQVADARAELEESVRLAPESFVCRSKYAEFLARLGFYDQAANQLDIALAGHPPDSDSRLAAMELRTFSRDKAKGIYYRHSTSPLQFRLRNLLPSRSSTPPATAPIERG